MSEASNFPELFIAVAGPIGVDIDAITACLTSALKEVEYESHLIKLTSEMLQFCKHKPQPKSLSFFDEIKLKIEIANEICGTYADKAALARIAIDAIIRQRQEIQPNDTIPLRTAYVIRQLKRPEEVALLRSVYGRQFILLSAYGPAEARKSLIEKKLRSTLPTATKPYEISCLAEELISIDASEDSSEYGQNLRETFPMADVFIDGIDQREMILKINRFVRALFGDTRIAPSKDEFGMYEAKSASLRSTDLSRQVGAALFSRDGELITHGCNEVPKVPGGTYWDLEEPDNRDVKLGFDPNERIKSELLRDLFEKLIKHNLLSEKALGLGESSDLVRRLTAKSANATPESELDGVLAGAAVMDLTEYGRVVHAEMCAICEAARLGRPIKGSTLYCTTFPCHNCTKHIIACGIMKVIYMEPYPKSRAKELHEHEISIEQDQSDRVSFLPFLGISPYRYRDIFAKGRRKDSDGRAKIWITGKPRPMIELATPSYIHVESVAAAAIVANKASSQEA